MMIWLWWYIYVMIVVIWLMVIWLIYSLTDDFINFHWLVGVDDWLLILYMNEWLVIVLFGWWYIDWLLMLVNGLLVDYWWLCEWYFHWLYDWWLIYLLWYFLWWWLVIWMLLCVGWLMLWNLVGWLNDCIYGWIYIVKCPLILMMNDCVVFYLLWIMWWLVIYIYSLMLNACWLVMIDIYLIIGDWLVFISVTIPVTDWLCLYIQWYDFSHWLLTDDWLIVVIVMIGDWL